MKVTRLQNNNYNLNFNAKFSINGKFNDIPSNVIKRWECMSKGIGTENDSILVNLKREKKRHIQDEYGNDITLFNRTASITKLINGEKSNDECALYAMNPFDKGYEGECLVEEKYAGNKEYRLQTTISVITKYLNNLYDTVNQVKK